MGTVRNRRSKSYDTCMTLVWHLYDTSIRTYLEGWSFHHQETFNIQLSGLFLAQWCGTKHKLKNFWKLQGVPPAHSQGVWHLYDTRMTLVWHLCRLQISWPMEFVKKNEKSQTLQNCLEKRFYPSWGLEKSPQPTWELNPQSFLDFGSQNVEKL